jgi:hypothetical protein
MDCQHCGRIIKNKGSLTAHQNVCKSNPNAIKYTRSPDAGRKSGSVPWNKGLKVGRIDHWDNVYPDEEIFVENSTFSRRSLKKRILYRNLIEYKCKICGCDPIWMGKPLVLILDHINGINNDNRLSNLRFVCSNCDSQLETYKSKNRRY